jgi:hypothetical protein
MYEHRNILAWLYPLFLKTDKNNSEKYRKRVIFENKKGRSETLSFILIIFSFDY